MWFSGAARGVWNGQNKTWRIWKTIRGPDSEGKNHWRISNFLHILNKKIGTPEFYQNTYSVKLKKIENRIKCPLKKTSAVKYIE